MDFKLINQKESIFFFENSAERFDKEACEPGAELDKIFREQT